MAESIIFDYDGVIVDSLNTIFLSWKEVSEEFDAKIKIKNIRQYKKMFKNNIVEMLNSIGLSEKELERYKEIWNESLKKNPQKIFEGIKEVLKKLSKKYKLAVVSGSTKETMESKFKEQNIIKYFDVLIGMIDPKKNKPNPFHINLAIKKLGVKPEEIIYIGDTKEDIQAARSASIKKIIGVSYGFGTLNSIKFEKPNGIVNSPNEILEVINKIEDGRTNSNKIN